MAMSQSEKYDYDVYIRRGDDYCRYAESSFNYRSYEDAKSRFFSAISEYKEAEDIAKKADDYSASQAAASKIRDAESRVQDCVRAMGEISRKRREDDPYDRNYKPRR